VPVRIKLADKAHSGSMLVENSISRSREWLDLVKNLPCGWYLTPVSMNGPIRRNVSPPWKQALNVAICFLSITKAPHGSSDSIIVRIRGQSAPRPRRTMGADWSDLAADWISPNARDPHLDERESRGPPLQLFQQHRAQGVDV